MSGRVYRLHSTLELPLEDLETFVDEEAELPEEMTQPVGRPSNEQSPSEASSSEKTKTTATRKKPDSEKNRSDRQTIPFPSAKGSNNNGSNGGATKGADERSSLENAIRQMLKTNGLSFPKAHTDWIDRELAKKPSTERLEQIIQHMQSVVGGEPETQEQPEQEESQQDHSEELIF
jgi:hypothetical protein